MPWVTDTLSTAPKDSAAPDFCTAAEDEAPGMRMRWERVDPDVLSALGERITTLSAELARSTYRLLALIEEFDRL
jgi:hypothetical protein